MRTPLAAPPSPHENALVCAGEKSSLLSRRSVLPLVNDLLFIFFFLRGQHFTDVPEGAKPKAADSYVLEPLKLKAPSLICEYNCIY